MIFSFKHPFSVEMSVDPDPEKQRCQGILDATGAAGADMGGKVTTSFPYYILKLQVDSVSGD